MNIIKILFLGIIPCLLLFAGYGGYKYATLKDLFTSSTASNMTYELYTLTKTPAWKERFDFLQSDDYNSQKKKIVGTRENFLDVRRGYQSYLIQYDTEIDVELISWVREVRQEGDQFQYQGRYFLVQYGHFVELVYFDITQSTTPLSSQVKNGTYQAEICLELPIEANSNVRYHIDEHQNIWIVTASMNKVVFIQIYSCTEKKLVEEFRYILKNGQNVNQISKIVKKDRQCMNVEVVTYNLNAVQLQVCPYRTTKSITENAEHRKSHHIKYQQKKVEEYEVLQGYSQSIYHEQFSKIVQYILNFITFSSNSSLLYDRKPSLDQNKKQYFDVITIDEQNNYLINFSKNTTYSGIIALDKYLINAKNPLFHGNPNYNKYGVLDLLDREHQKEYNPDVQHKYIIPGLNQTKKVTYKAAYRIYPDFKVEYLGITSKVIVFWPQEKLEEKDYSFVRTNQGGLVSQGTNFKGSFDKLPVTYEEVYQRVDAKAIEVIPSIFQVHVGYTNLMTYLIRSKDDQQFIRVQLLNMLGGRPFQTHYIGVKQGFRYISTMLLNNQWWVLQYNIKQKRSMATKYELYANATNPSQVLTVKRVYGVIGSEEHMNGEDDLAEIMSEFLNKHQNGYILFNVYRCIDQYYYVEYTDASGQVFGVVRIHFKNFSNRRIKKSKKYSGTFERMLLIDQKEMIPERYSRKPYSVYLKNMNVLSHLPSMFAKNNAKDVWHRICDQKGRNFKKLQKLGGFHYFPISHYGIGQYGCDFSSDSPHAQAFYVFNMRNMIIDGKKQVEDRSHIRREIIVKMFYGVAGYIGIAIIAWIVILASSKKSPNEKEVKKEKQEGKKNK